MKEDPQVNEWILTDTFTKPCHFFRYAADENLEPCEPELVTHPQIGKYFQVNVETKYMHFLCLMHAVQSAHLRLRLPSY